MDSYKSTTWKKILLAANGFLQLYKSNQSVEWFKARLAAKGFTNQYGIDYPETFTPMAKLNNVCVLLSLAVNLASSPTWYQKCLLEWWSRTWNSKRTQKEPNNIKQRQHSAIIYCNNKKEFYKSQYNQKTNINAKHLQTKMEINPTPSRRLETSPPTAFTKIKPTFAIPKTFSFYTNIFLLYHHHYGSLRWFPPFQ